MDYLMRWYYKVAGGHTHVRVFMNGAKCGDLVFRNEEFKLAYRELAAIEFIDETEKDS